MQLFVKHIRLSSKLAHHTSAWWPHREPCCTCSASCSDVQYIVPAQCIKESDVGIEKWGAWCSWFHCRTYPIVVNIYSSHIRLHHLFCRVMDWPTGTSLQDECVMKVRYYSQYNLWRYFSSNCIENWFLIGQVLVL